MDQAFISDEAFQTRFWTKVDVHGPDECWPWTGARTIHGYGKIVRRPVEYRTHRLSYFFSSPDFDQSLCVLHRCDNPPCCNPRHLFLGTIADNVHDMDAKGRAIRNVGERNGRAKISKADVAEMRRLWDLGWTQTALAGQFGVSQPRVSKIVRGLAWTS